MAKVIAVRNGKRIHRPIQDAVAGIQKKIAVILRPRSREQDLGWVEREVAVVEEGFPLSGLDLMTRLLCRLWKTCRTTMT